MSEAVISKSAFFLAPASQGAYELQIQFLSSDDSPISSKKFTFTPTKGAGLAKDEGKVSKSDALQSAELLDVYSQNGECTVPEKLLKKLFGKRDVADVTAAAGVVKASGFEGPTILVLDLKDHEQGYRDKAGATIAKCEQVACEFFKGKALEKNAPAHAQNFKSKFNPDFVLREGTLKVDLLKTGGFTPAEVEYFHTRPGATSLCQTAEFFMNAFKFGEVAKGGSGEFFAGKYIEPVSGKFSSFQPCSVSTVLYPPPYAKIYAVDGVYAKTIAPVFHVKGGIDPVTNITTMSVARKV